jgi:predicted component of type VI protein secretion system
MPLNAKLIVVGGDVKTAEIKLRLPSTIGRGRGASIMLPHPLVSRQHCELFESQGKLMVRDLGSLNGTFINNERISEAPLPTGELLTIGAVTFRAIYEVDHSAKTMEADSHSAGEPIAGSDTPGIDPKGTVRAPSKPPRTSALTVNLEEPIDADLGSGDLGSEDLGSDDLDFSQPVSPVDEGARVTLRAEAPVLPAEDPPAEACKTEPSAPASPGKPAAASPTGPASGTAGTKPAPTKSPERPANKPPEKKDEPTVHFAAWENEEGEVRPAVIEDEDFGDFLKSLEEKQ